MNGQDDLQRAVEDGIEVAFARVDEMARAGVPFDVAADRAVADMPPGEAEVVRGGLDCIRDRFIALEQGRNARMPPAQEDTTCPPAQTADSPAAEPGPSESSRNP